MDLQEGSLVSPGVPRINFENCCLEHCLTTFLEAFCPKHTSPKASQKPRTLTSLAFLPVVSWTISLCRTNNKYERI